jgi:multidrug efflux pump subunit AcrB
MLDFSLRHPVTVMVAMVGIILGSVFAVQRMKFDVFPDLNMPVIYVAQPYGGMDSAQMEGLITNYYEYAFLYMTGIDHVESKNIQHTALIKIYFHPGTDMAQAMAEAAIYANRCKAFFPPGTVPPFIMRLDASMVPVAYVVMACDQRAIGELSDMMLFKVRPVLASLPGASAPMPFGSAFRTIIVHLDPERLRAYNLSPNDVANALNVGNLITPSGNAQIGPDNPVVSVNSMVSKKEELGDIPLKLGSNVYMRDVGWFEDGTDIPTGYALVNGHRSIYLPINKTGDASTLDVANELKEALPRMQTLVPEDVHLSLEFDQSPYVTGAVGGVVEESVIGAVLTGLMVLLFLRDWRSVIVVVLTIPLALFGAVVGLFAVGQTINLMTLGGLSLAVGILVDEGTVVIENIHTRMGKTASLASAVRTGTAETIVPNMLAMLCILAVFLPSFLMEGAARGLFIPLSIAVGFAMIIAFLLSTSFVPVTAIWLVKHFHHHEDPDAGGFSFARIRRNYGKFVRRALPYRWMIIPSYLIVALLVLLIFGTQVGREIAPTVDSGQFQIRIHTPTGSNLDLNEDLTRQTLEQVKDLAGADNIAISVAYVGIPAPTLTVNSIYLWSGGTDQSIMRVALVKDCGLRVAELQAKLRDELPKRIKPWLKTRLEKDGVPSSLAAERSQQVTFSYEPSDVVNQVMSFGSPTPIEIVVSGPNMMVNKQYADRIHANLQGIKSLRDLQFVQSLDYPRVKVDIDRERASFAGITVADAANSLIAGTFSSRYVLPIFWADPTSGIGYQIQVEVPPARVDSVNQVGMIPLKKTSDGGQLELRDIAKIHKETMPEEYDRLNQLRYISLTANIEGEDLGRVSNHIDEAINAARMYQVTDNRIDALRHATGWRAWLTYVGFSDTGAPEDVLNKLKTMKDKQCGTKDEFVAELGKVLTPEELNQWKDRITSECLGPPRGVQVQVRGQVLPMLQMFKGLVVGLALAVVMVALLLTAYFQSPRLALVASGTAPAVIAGVALALYITNTTLNIESFMGAIMAIGVAVANAILLVTFAERNRQTGMSAAEAAVTGASERLRPILMTSCAMIAGMVPMALGYGQGGEQTASLGRAVIGGLLAATAATLLILPHVFAIVLGRSPAGSPSLHPHDRDSRHYDPTDGAEADGHAAESHSAPGGHGEPHTSTERPPHTDGETPIH